MKIKHTRYDNNVGFIYCPYVPTFDVEQNLIHDLSDQIRKEIDAEMLKIVSVQPMSEPSGKIYHITMVGGCGGNSENNFKKSKEN